MLHRILASLATLALLAACAPTQARPLVDVSVVDRDRDEWLSQYPHRGDIWVAGAPGHRYSVRLTNTTGERVLVVLSIDGVNAITGQTAHPSQAGYVLEPWQTTEINGWRKSMQDVAQFVFTDLPDSYAARTGRPRNVGVVGVAVFREARPVAYAPPPMPYPAPYERDEAARESAAQPAAKAGAPAPSAPSRADNAVASEEADTLQRQRLGTGHGQREWSQVSHTDFERATRSPSQVTELRYDDTASLVAMGVLPRPRPYWSPQPPRAFPDGFVADPPGG